MIRSFLWSGSYDLKYKVKVAWNSVCKDKKQGGLGIRRLHEWNRACPLHSALSNQEISSIRASCDHFIAEFIANGRVVGGIRATLRIQQLQSSLSVLNDRSDVIVIQWKNENSFRCKSAWKEICQESYELSTKDRLKNWQVELDWMINKCKGKRFGAKLCRVSFCCVVYCVWMERNRRIFKKEKLGVDEVLFLCVNNIRNIAYSWRNIANTKDNWTLCLEWGLSLSILKNG
ncbi:hypothetical protein LIER_19582 [Lithospermum erythrorhizon]|uniref:Uncharacterized protein n=1 Tax=Lithospermum erythrorhizon TaxID=34254 RepID=A0AAV3QI76_LITER